MVLTESVALEKKAMIISEAVVRETTFSSEVQWLTLL